MLYKVLDEDSSFVNGTEYTLSEHTYTHKLLWVSSARAAGNRKSQGRGTLRQHDGMAMGLVGFDFPEIGGLVLELSELIKLSIIECRCCNVLLIFGALNATLFKGMFGRVRTKVYRGYRYLLGKGPDTGSRYLGKFGVPTHIYIYTPGNRVPVYSRPQRRAYRYLFGAILGVSGIYA